MTERQSDTETTSYRDEQAKRGTSDPRGRQADAPVAPSSGGVLADHPVPHEWIDGGHRDGGELREVY
jgi:hypothetical protein